MHPYTRLQCACQYPQKGRVRHALRPRPEISEMINGEMLSTGQSLLIRHSRARWRVRDVGECFYASVRGDDEKCQESRVFDMRR